MKQILISYDEYNEEKDTIRNNAFDNAFRLVKLYITGDKDVVKWFQESPDRYGNIAEILDKYYVRKDESIRHTE